MQSEVCATTNLEVLILKVAVRATWVLHPVTRNARTRYEHNMHQQSLHARFVPWTCCARLSRCDTAAPVPGNTTTTNRSWLATAPRAAHSSGTNWLELMVKVVESSTEFAMDVPWAVGYAKSTISTSVLSCSAQIVIRLCAKK